MEKKELKFDFVFIPTEFADMFIKSGEYKSVVESSGTTILSRVEDKKDIPKEQLEDI